MQVKNPIQMVIFKLNLTMLYRKVQKKFQLHLIFFVYVAESIKEPVVPSNHDK